MKFHEAVETGKRFRYPRMRDGDYYFIDKEDILIEFIDGASSDEFVSVKFNKAFFTRDDWEVVEVEIIEVGDVVERKTDPSYEQKVIWRRGNSSTALVQYKTDLPVQEDISKLKLIRKGMKVHVFEGIGVNEKGGMLQYPEHGEGLHLRGSVFWKMRGNGKTYDMTLTERPDA